MCKQKEGRQRGTWNGKKTDNDFYKKIVCKNTVSSLVCCTNWTVKIWLIVYCWQVDAYEVKNQELMAENADLRALLRSMQVLVKHCIPVVS